MYRDPFSTPIIARKRRLICEKVIRGHGWSCRSAADRIFFDSQHSSKFFAQLLRESTPHPRAIDSHLPGRGTFANEH